MENETTFWGTIGAMVVAGLYWAIMNIVYVVVLVMGLGSFVWVADTLFGLNIGPAYRNMMKAVSQWRPRTVVKVPKNAPVQGAEASAPVTTATATANPTTTAATTPAATASPAPRAKRAKAPVQTGTAAAA